MGYIYKATNILNNQIVYVGQTKRPCNIRWNKHKSNARNNKGSLFQQYISNIGEENIKFDILEEINNSYLNIREQYWIKKLHTHKSEGGYNATWGGETSSGWNNKIIYCYNIDGNFIKKYQSIEEACWDLQLINGHGNICKALEGKINIAYNHRWSTIYQDKLNPITSKYTGCAKPVDEYRNNELYKHWSSIGAAARYYHKSQGNIWMAANGQRKSAYGSIWKMVN